MIGVANISAYSNGLMGYETPNIDRIGREGIKFLHYYGEQSCTAGRAAFLTGQHGIRSGMTKVRLGAFGWRVRGGRACGQECPRHAAEVLLSFTCSPPNRHISVTIRT